MSRSATSSPRSGSGARSAWRVATARNFGPYFLGNAISASGTWFHNLAASVFIYQGTHSAFLLGLLNFCQFLPVLLLSPWAGRFADTYDRRKILFVTQPAAALTSGVLAGLVLSGHASVGAVFLVSLCLGSLYAFANASQMAMVGSLVDRVDLPQAIALNSITWNVARAVGPLGAAVVIAAFGTATAFAVNSLSYLLFTVGLALVHTAPLRRPNRTTLRDALTILAGTPRLLGYLAVIATVSFATDPVNTEGPALAARFGLDPIWAGAIVGVFGAGAVSAGILVGGRVATARRTGRTLAMVGCGILGLAVTPWFAIALAFAAAAGFGYLSSNAAATSQLQLAVDETVRGRLMAVWAVAFLGVRPIASLLDGVLAELFGVRAATALMSAPAFVLASTMLVFARRNARMTAAAAGTGA